MQQRRESIPGVQSFPVVRPRQVERRVDNRQVGRGEEEGRRRRTEVGERDARRIGIVQEHTRKMAAGRGQRVVTGDPVQRTVGRPSIAGWFEQWTGAGWRRDQNRELRFENIPEMRVDGRGSVALDRDPPSGSTARARMPAAITGVMREREYAARWHETRITRPSACYAHLLMRRTNWRLLVCVGCAWGVTNIAGGAAGQSYRELAGEVLAEIVAVDTSVEGVGTTRAAELIMARLRSAGYAEADMQLVGPDPPRRNLIVTLRGSGQRRPLLLIAHLDVVPAHRQDWSFDPFSLTEQDGWFYGRGTRDNKAGVATLVTNLVRWKQERFTPNRDVIVLLTAFEEQGGAGGIPWVLEHHRDLLKSEFCLNTDSGEGLLENGKPKVIRLQAAEKVFQSFRLELTHPGGHSSVPGPDNPIYQLASALTRLSAHRFPPRLTPVTRAFFERSADLEGGPRAADMRAVAAGTPDLAAAERLSADPWFNALLRTTCVPTQLAAGHAENALPQRVTAIINCRILPGEAPADVQSTLVKVIGDPVIQVSPVRPADMSEASPLIPAIVETIERIAKRRWGIPLVPVMETGGTDGLHLRNRGVATYGISGIFDPPGENRMHGRDERVHVESYYGAVDFWDEMVRAFAGGTP